MGEILVSATFPNLSKDNLEEFKRRAEEAVAVARDEPGTLQFDCFLSADQTKCVVRERYASSEAMLAHLSNIGPLLGPLAKLGGGLDSEVFGDLSPELRQVLAPAVPTLYSHLTGK